jgi:hypothetical protein
MKLHPIEFHDLDKAGLVLKYLIKSTDSEFYLFDDGDKTTKENRKRNNLFYLLKVLASSPLVPCGRKV